MIGTITSVRAIDVGKVVLSEDPWPPYILGEEGFSATGGSVVDILNIVFSNLDIDLEMNLYPWTRSLRLVKGGQEDGHMLLIKTPEWDQYMVYSIPFIEDRYLLWTRTSDGPIEWQTYDDLKPFFIALTENYSYTEGVERAIKAHKLNVTYARSDEINFRLLSGGRVDAFICLESVALSLFKKNPEFKKRFVASDNAIAELALMMSLNKNSAASKLMPAINQQLEMLKNSGEIQKIIKQYR